MIENNIGLRRAVFIEGATLLLLIFIAVPLKRIVGIKEAVEIMGPVHGLAFLSFAYFLIEAIAAKSIDNKGVVRLLVGAVIPFGGVFNERWLSSREKA